MDTWCSTLSWSTVGTLRGSFWRGTRRAFSKIILNNRRLRSVLNPSKQAVSRPNKSRTQSQQVPSILCFWATSLSRLFHLCALYSVLKLPTTLAWKTRTDWEKEPDWVQKCENPILCPRTMSSRNINCQHHPKLGWLIIGKPHMDRCQCHPSQCGLPSEVKRHNLAAWR